MQFGDGRFLLTMCCAAVLGTGASATPQTSTTRPTTPALPGPVRDPGGSGAVPLPPTGNGTISGTIAVSPSGLPAAAVRVAIYGRDVPNRSTLTDGEGRFSFAGLPVGRYTITAAKPGHVNITYGQRRPGGSGTEIPLAEGQRVQIALQIPRGAVITGTVLDERGEPAIGVQVRGVRMLARGQRREMMSSSTDDRGIYRLHSLQPGNYAVCASPRNMGPQTESQRTQMELDSLRRSIENFSAAQSDQVRRQMAARLAQLKEQLQSQPVTGYAPVCYPNSVSADSGTIAVAAGEERSAIDLQLVLTPVARVEGTIVRPPGTDQHQVMLQLSTSEGAASDFDRGQGASVDDNGRFLFQSVPPGQYTLTALMTAPDSDRPNRAGVVRPPQPRYWARTDVAVAGQDVSDIVLELQRGATVSGHFVFDGTHQQPPSDITRGQISIFPFSPQTMGFAFESNARGTIDASGRFTIPDVLPGKYRFSASFPGPLPWLAQEIVISGQDALDFPLEVKPSQNVTGVVMTLTDQQAELSGSIVDEKGQPATEHTILLYAADPKYWIPQSRRVRAIRAGADGYYTFRAVPPGDYRLTTLVDPDPDLLNQREVLEQLDPSSVRITLGKGEKRVEHVRVR